MIVMTIRDGIKNPHFTSLMILILYLSKMFAPVISVGNFKVNTSFLVTHDCSSKAMLFLNCDSSKISRQMSEARLIASGLQLEAQSRIHVPEVVTSWAKPAGLSVEACKSQEA